MKKLLFITSLLVCCAFVGACQSHSKSSSKDTQSAGTKSTGNTQSSSSSEGTSDTHSAVKDSTRKPIGGKAIVHSDPNQAQLDSLKKAKTKSKNDK